MKGPAASVCVDFATAEGDIGGVRFRIVGHVDHRLRLAPLSHVTVIMRIGSSVSKQTARRIRPPNSGTARNRRHGAVPVASPGRTNNPARAARGSLFLIGSARVSPRTAPVRALFGIEEFCGKLNAV